MHRQQLTPCTMYITEAYLKAIQKLIKIMKLVVLKPLFFPTLVRNDTSCLIG